MIFVIKNKLNYFRRNFTEKSHSTLSKRIHAIPQYYKSNKVSRKESKNEMSESIKVFYKYIFHVAQTLRLEIILLSFEKEKAKFHHILAVWVNI